MIEIHFPNESEARASLDGSCGALFEFSRRLLRFWLIADKDKGIAKSTLAPVVLRVVLAMSTKAARQFRTVIELCERGEAADAAMVSRGLFETTLVIGFVLKDRFSPREFHSDGSVRKKITVPGVRLNREFRATLYVAHAALKPELFEKRHEKRPGMKRAAKRMGKISKDEVAEPYKQAIGPEWTKILSNHPRTYSGLTIAGLARSLGRPFSNWYDSVYGFQSEHTHAADLLHHMQFDDDGTTVPCWMDSDTYVQLTMPTAIAMFLASVGMINETIGLGVTMNTALHGFNKAYMELVEGS